MAFGHEQLDVYRTSIEYVGWAYRLCERLKGHRNAKDQLLRASQAIPLNIAEGNGKATEGDRRRFFEIARGSALECAAAQDVLTVCGALSEEESETAKKLLDRIVAMLTKLGRRGYVVHESLRDYGNFFDSANDPDPERSSKRPGVHSPRGDKTGMKNIKDLNIKDKKVLIRVDFNVPMDDQGNITDDIRIREVLPTINHALDERARIIICSHMGRPKGRRMEKFSMAPAARRLSRLLDKPVAVAPDCIGPETEAMVAAMAPGDVLMLENLRFHAGEQENDPEFAARLAGLAEVYVNDAFAVAHRAHASVVGVVNHLRECGAGFLLQKEMDYFHRSVGDPKRPLVAIVGGAKVSSKLGALRNLLDRVDKMIVGGAMANTFLKSAGYNVGKSRVEDDLLETARDLMAQAARQQVKFYLPVDCVVAAEFEAKADHCTVTAQEVPEERMILDIGPATTLLFGEALENARTIIWNGPMGAFEMEAFSRGTMAMVKRLAASQALTIVGGGDTDVAVHRAGESDNISYISTGGGAFLMLMEGKTLPGVAALEKNGREMPEAGVTEDGE